MVTRQYSYQYCIVYLKVVEGFLKFPPHTKKLEQCEVMNVFPNFIMVTIL